MNAERLAEYIRFSFIVGTIMFLFAFALWTLG
jgi:hypothetical protein